MASNRLKALGSMSLIHEKTHKDNQIVSGPFATQFLE